MTARTSAAEKEKKVGATVVVAPRFVAGARLQVDGGWREPGEPVPEAESWPLRQIQALINLGRLVDLSTKPKPRVGGPVPSGDPLITNRQITRKR